MYTCTYNTYNYIVYFATTSLSAKDWLSSTLVLPNFKCLEITSDERLLSLAACTREPIGVLKVHACRGLNLAGAPKGNAGRPALLAGFGTWKINKTKGKTMEKTRSTCR